LRFSGIGTLRRSPRLSRSLLIAAAAGLGVVVSSRILADQIELQSQVEAAQWLDPVSSVLTSEMTRSFRISSFLAATVVMDPALAGNPERLRQVAQPLLESEPGALALQLAPGGVLQQQIPPSKSAPIGLDLLHTPANRASAELAIRTRATVMQGPFPLVQGGHGIVVRTPVFIGNPSRFWGFASALLDWDRLLTIARAAAPDSDNLRLVIRDGSPIGRVIAGQPSRTGLPARGSVTVPFSQGSFYLEAVTDQTFTLWQTFLIAIASLGVGALSAGLAWFVLLQISTRLNAQKKANAVPYVTFSAMTEIARRRDEETGQHLLRCSLYAREMAQALRRSRHPEAKHLSDRDIDAMAAAVPLHDIGKVGIPDAILHKPGPLDPAERAVMNRHTTLGAEVIERLAITLPEEEHPMMIMARHVAIGHHENWDGSGYPNGLAGHDIPLIARIMSVIDVYDALVSKRVYKEAMPHEQVLQEMARLRGRKFDPDLVDAMLRLQATFRAIYEANQDQDDSPSGP
jgi:HD-GYP domain-containing protein (c-di-GMP phosphodiesterase class II)